MRTTLTAGAALLMWTCAPLGVANAQSVPSRFEASVQVVSAFSSQVPGPDAGVGGRLAWHLSRLVGVDSEVVVYPAAFPTARPFSRTRLESVFGVTVGPRSGRISPSLGLRAGLLRVREAPAPLACVLIYPPPLSCELASGRRLAAIEFGGGVDVSTTGRTFLRVDVGDRMLRYPGPVLDHRGTRRDRPFFSHGARLAVGAGARF